MEKTKTSKFKFKEMFNFKIGDVNVAKNVVDLDKPMIKVDKYTKIFGKFTSTENVTFEVGHGVIHGFIGPNGSGKTTTIKAMIGAYLPTTGEVWINGNKAGTRAANSMVGYIPERASFPKHLNTESYLSAMGELSGLKPKASKARANEILVSLQLEKQAKRKPTTFSSGMQKKILLAQALMTNPSILILDEPAANLDPTARKELFDQLIELRNQGKTILISSHILSELERLIDEATFIYYGEVIHSGSIAEILKHHSSAFIKSSDNEKLSNYLLEKNYKITGDIKTEIQVVHLTDEAKAKLFKDIEACDVNIISYRTNDLQSVYDAFAKEAFKQNRGKQKLGEESTVKHVVKETDTVLIKKPKSKKEAKAENAKSKSLVKAAKTKNDKKAPATDKGGK